MKTDVVFKTDSTLQEYTRAIREHLGECLQSVILFGSRARGDARDGSDYDVLVVVRGPSLPAKHMVADIGADMLYRHDQLFAALVYDAEQWEEVRHSPLGWNIEREGVAI
jgi:predicted nucleotidyltransferase